MSPLLLTILVFVAILWTIGGFLYLLLSERDGPKVLTVLAVTPLVLVGLGLLLGLANAITMSIFGY